MEAVKEVEQHLEKAREAVKRVLLDTSVAVANDIANIFQLEGENFSWDLVRPDPPLVQDLLTPHTHSCVRPGREKDLVR